MSFLYLHKPYGYTLEDIEADIKAMTREQMQAEARAFGLEEGVEKLQDLFIEEVLRQANIKYGDKCVMHFTDGAEVVEYLEVKNGRIYVRHFGTRGRPYKNPTGYNYYYAELLEKQNAGDGQEEVS